jgi:hypothetical protein
LQADDVILTKVSPALNFNELKNLISGIFDPVRRSNRNIDGLASLNDYLAII